MEFLGRTVSKNGELPKSQKCTRCNQYKELKYFGKDHRGKNGRKRLCNYCKKEESALYRSLKKESSYHKAYYLLKNMCRKHEKLGIKELPEFTVEEIANIIDNECCEVSGMSFNPVNTTSYRSNPYMASPDRIDTSVGYTKQNVRWVCVWVNICRNYYTLDDFKKFIGIIKNDCRDR